MNNLTDEEIAYMFRRAADVLEGVADPDTGQREDYPEDMPPDPEDNADPWGSDTHTRQTSTSRSSQGRQPRGAARGSARGGERSGRAQDRSQSRGRGQANPGADVPRSGSFEDSRGKLWEFGLSDAPSCQHRMPAAYVTGDKRDGGVYHAWACPIGFTDSWKDKCDLWEFTS